MLLLSVILPVITLTALTTAYTTESPDITLEQTSTNLTSELNAVPETDLPPDLQGQMVTHSGAIMFDNFTAVEGEVDTGVTISGDSPMGSQMVFGMEMKQIEDYFRHYHYLGVDMPDESLAKLAETNMTMAMNMATTLFQRRYAQYGLTVNGELDEATVDLIKMPRCGVPDLGHAEDMMKRKKRFALSGGKWDHYDLTYTIRTYPQDGDLTIKQVNREIARAFKVWQDVTPLTFRVSGSDTADIVIDFGARSHGDPFPFDGRGGVLAHAFYPLYGGASHFDEDEVWTIKTDRGTNLFQVAAHEFGHALGLAHSTDPTALMAPFYMGYVPDFQLPQDDIAGIQQKYGPPTIPTPETGPVKPTDMGPSTQPPTMSPEMSDICADSRFDTITTMLDGDKHKLFGFKGKFYFLIESNGGIAPGYPRLISDDWPGLPDDIDAALFREAEINYKWEWNKKKGEWELMKYTIMIATTYIFKGDQYWKIENMSVMQGYPLPITDWGVSVMIDAAFVWHGNNKIYFIKGDSYFRIDVPQSSSGALGVVADGYPRPLSLWRGLPSSVDAAFQWSNEQTYFMSGLQYYLYDDENFMVAEGYPRNNEGFWLRCYRYKTSQQQGMTGNETVTDAGCDASMTGPGCDASITIPHLVMVISALILSML